MTITLPPSCDTELSPATQAVINSTLRCIDTLLNENGAVPTVAAMLTPTGMQGMGGAGKLNWLDPDTRKQAVYQLRLLCAHHAAKLVIVSCPDWLDNVDGAVLYCEFPGKALLARTHIERDDIHPNLGPVRFTECASGTFYPLLTANGALSSDATT